MESLPPPHVLVENTASCEDLTAASEQIGNITRETTAPESWTVTITIREKGHELEGEGEIKDGQGRRIGFRTLTSPTPQTCTPLARALGIWATLVLDEARSALTEANEKRAREAADATAAAPKERARSRDAREPMWKHQRIGVTTSAMTDFMLSVPVGLGAYVALESNGSAVLMPHVMLGYPAHTFPPPAGTPPRKAPLAVAVGVDACAAIPAGSYVVFEECGVVQYDYGSTQNAQGTPSMTPAVGFGQGVRVELSTGYWLDLRLRALFNVSSISSLESNSNPPPVASPIIAEAGLGFSWTSW